MTLYGPNGDPLTPPEPDGQIEGLSWGVVLLMLADGTLAYLMVDPADVVVADVGESQFVKLVTRVVPENGYLKSWNLAPQLLADLLRGHAEFVAQMAAAEAEAALAAELENLTPEDFDDPPI